MSGAGSYHTRPFMTDVQVLQPGFIESLAAQRFRDVYEILEEKYAQGVLAKDTYDHFCRAFISQQDAFKWFHQWFLSIYEDQGNPNAPIDIRTKIPWYYDAIFDLLHTSVKMAHRVDIDTFFTSQSEPMLSQFLQFLDWFKHNELTSPFLNDTIACSRDQLALLHRCVSSRSQADQAEREVLNLEWLRNICQQLHAPVSTMPDSNLRSLNSNFQAPAQSQSNVNISPPRNTGPNVSSHSVSGFMPSHGPPQKDTKEFADMQYPSIANVSGTISGQTFRMFITQNTVNKKDLFFDNETGSYLPTFACVSNETSENPLYRMILPVRRPSVTSIVLVNNRNLEKINMLGSLCEPPLTEKSLEWHTEKEKWVLIRVEGTNKQLSIIREAICTLEDPAFVHSSSIVNEMIAEEVFKQLIKYMTKWKQQQTILNDVSVPKRPREETELPEPNKRQTADRNANSERISAGELSRDVNVVDPEVRMKLRLNLCPYLNSSAHDVQDCCMFDPKRIHCSYSEAITKAMETANPSVDYNCSTIFNTEFSTHFNPQTFRLPCYHDHLFKVEARKEHDKILDTCSLKEEHYDYVLSLPLPNKFKHFINMLRSRVSVPGGMNTIKPELLHYLLQRSGCTLLVTSPVLNRKQESHNWRYLLAIGGKFAIDRLQDFISKAIDSCATAPEFNMQTVLQIMDSCNFPELNPVHLPPLQFCAQYISGNCTKRQECMNLHNFHCLPTLTGLYQNGERISFYHKIRTADCIPLVSPVFYPGIAKVADDFHVQSLNRSQAISPSQREWVGAIPVPNYRPGDGESSVVHRLLTFDKIQSIQNECKGFVLLRNIEGASRATCCYPNYSQGTRKLCFQDFEYVLVFGERKSVEKMVVAVFYLMELFHHSGGRSPPTLSPSDWNEISKRTSIQRLDTNTRPLMSPFKYSSPRNYARPSTSSESHSRDSYSSNRQNSRSSSGSSHKYYSSSQKYHSLGRKDFTPRTETRFSSNGGHSHSPNSSRRMDYHRHPSFESSLSPASSATAAAASVALPVSLIPPISLDGDEIIIELPDSDSD